MILGPEPKPYVRTPARAAVLCAIVLLLPSLGEAQTVGEGGAEPTEELWRTEGQTLRQLVEVADGANRSEMLLRLGEWEREAAVRLQRGSEGARAASLSAEELEDQVRRHLDAADEALSRSVEEASEERRPVVLFALGDLRRFRGDFKGASEPFSLLVEEFPDHPLAIDAAIASGDDAFEDGGLARAMERYRFAAERAEGSATAYAWYKLAWCHINLEEFAEARELLVRVIESGAEGKGQLSLAEDARRDLVIALARDASVAAPQADELLRRHAPEERVLRYQEGYVQIIADAGRDEEAAALLSSLVESAPPDAAVRLSATEVEIAVRRRDLPTAVSAARRLAEVIASHSVDEEAARRAEQVLRVSSVRIHGEGRAGNRKPLLEAARAMYEAYFQAFDASASAYDLHHHAGELLHGLGLPAEAERHYTAAVERDLLRLDRGESPGRWLAPSAHGAVVAAYEVLPKEAEPSARSADGDEDFTRRPPEPVDFSGPEARYVAACDRYLKALPSGEHAPEIAYGRALVYYRRHHYLDASRDLAQVALAYPGSSVSTFAAEVALDALRVMGRYDDLAELASRFRAEPTLKERLGDRLAELRDAALLAAAARDASFGEHALAASRYLSFVESTPSSRRLDRALYNAASSLSALGRLDEAVTIRFRLLEEVSGSDLITRARAAQVADLVTLGRFDEASDLALAVADAAKGSERAAKLHDSIVLAEASGDAERAAELRRRYLLRHPKGDDVMAHAAALVDAASGCDARRKAGRRALALAPDDGWRAVWHGRLADLEQGCGRRGDAVAHARRAVGLLSRVEDRADALDAIAQSALVLAEGAVDRFRRTPFKEPYERTLPKKIQSLHAAEAELAEVVAKGRARPAVCALVRSGEIHADLARALIEAPAPDGFSEEQQILFTETLAAEAEPLFDHARDTLEAALVRARETAVAPGCLSDATTILARLAPSRFGDSGEFVATLTPPMEPEPMSAREVLRSSYDAPSAWLVAARAELMEGRAAAALLLADRVEKDDPLRPMAREVRARALEAAGRGDAALAAWQALARDVPNRPLALRALSDHAMRLRDRQGARALLESLQTLEPEDADVHLNLGVVLRALGLPSEAEAAFRHSASLASGRPQTHLNLGLLLCADGGRPEEGLKELEAFRRSGEAPPDGARFEAAWAACEALAGGSGR